MSCSTHPATSMSSGESLSSYYQRVAAVKKSPVTSPRFYNGGVAIKAAMLDLIDSAKQQILVSSFLLTEGPESSELLRALSAKSAEGVDVRVIGDSSSRFVVETEGFSYLSQHRVPVAEFHPIRGIRLLSLRNTFERDHRKYWVVDGHRVLLGGANLSDASLLSAEGGGNLDLMVGFDSVPVAQILAESFVRTWKESARSVQDDPAPVRPVENAANFSVEYWVFNQDKVQKSSSLSESMLEGLFASAQESLWLIGPYTFTTHRLLAQIRSMTARGVDVNIVLSNRTRAPRFHYAALYGVKDLRKAGARVWIYNSETTPLHYKCALVDGRLAFVGSTNVNYRSLHLARELSVVFDDTESIESIRQVVETLREGSREPSDEEARSYRISPFVFWWMIMQVAG